MRPVSQKTKPTNKQNKNIGILHRHISKKAIQMVIKLANAHMKRWST
jgi:hypothetical protein